MYVLLVVSYLLSGLFLISVDVLGNGVQLLEWAHHASEGAR